MWSTALCTIGVTKPMNICNCLSFRQHHGGATPTAPVENDDDSLDFIDFRWNSFPFVSFIRRSLEERDLWKFGIAGERSEKVSSLEASKSYSSEVSLQEGRKTWKAKNCVSLLGKDKLGVPASEPVRLVLEIDGTQVEDGEYFRTLANNTILLLLRQGDRWYPTGVDVIKAGL